MAVPSQQVASPDGRTWNVTVERTRRRLKDTRDEPFFWAHVIVTGILVALLIFFLRHDWSGIWAVAIPACVILWLIGFVVSATGSQIRAETPGPPAEHRGDLTAEPEDTRLEEI
jgi:hypothetical protein